MWFTMKNAVFILSLASSVQSRSVATTENCISENAGCEVHGDNLLAEHNATNRVGCVERCYQHDRCQQWTWWADSQRCQLFSVCPAHVQCQDCLRGDRSCGTPARCVALVSGGLDANSTADSSVVFVGEQQLCSPPDFLKAMTQLPSPRYQHVSAFIESVLVVCGGGSGTAPVSSCDQFSLASWAWSHGPSMRLGRAAAAGVAVLGKFIVSGGNTDQGVTNTVEILDPFTGVWTAAAPLPEGLAGHCAVSDRDSVVVVGGTTVTGMQSNRTYRFNVTTGRWARLPDLTIARTGHACSTRTMNAGLEIVVTGGDFRGAALRTTEVLSLSQLAWRAGAELPLGLAGHSQTNTRVTGGEAAGRPASLVLEEQAGEWVMSNVSLPGGRALHSSAHFPASLLMPGC